MPFIHQITGALLVGTAALAAHAQGSFPERPVTLVVPYPAGGVADTIARPLAVELGKRL